MYMSIISYVRNAHTLDNESEYFSETLAAESLSQYQGTSSPSLSVSPVPAAPLSINTTTSSAGNASAQQVYSSSAAQPAYTSQISPQHSKATPMYNAAPKYSAPPQVQQQQPPPQQSKQQHYHHPATNDHVQTNSSGYHTQSYGGPAQQLQPQTLQPSQQHQNYNHIRHSVLQSSVNPSGAVGQQQQQQQQKYYDQYDNYARPIAQNVPAYNNNYQQHATAPNNNVASGYNSHPQSGYQQQPTTPYNSGYTTNHYNSANGGSGHSVHYGNGGGGGGGNVTQQPTSSGGSGIGKISDYDPLSDGPRNVVPASNRNSATLIYNSSDRGVGKLPPPPRAVLGAV